MDFFARQDRARAQTGQLLMLFVLSVLVVVAVITAVLVLVLGASNRDPDVIVGTADWWLANVQTIALCALGVLVIVLAGTGSKLQALRGGGAVVARSMGGDLVDASTSDPLQQRLLHVVEEMAMASGVPVPAVYVLGQESAINAFAAGNTPADSAIAVTRGALEKLDRAELQGVIGHEFSHILNGDMRLNMRLLACVAGLFAIATVGRVLMRGGRVSRKAGGIALVGFTMFVLGWIGVALGRMIQAAISRQREFLADASAVQFTRDPSGLKQALVKIGAIGGGSRLVSHETGDVAHMLFASGLGGLFATHPPLEERIRALDPSFKPDEIVREAKRLAAAAAAPATGSVPATPAVSQWVARPRLEHLLLASQALATVPQNLLGDAGDPQRAVQLLWALLLSKDDVARQSELHVLAAAYPPELLAGVQSRRGALAALPPGLRVPLLLRLFPALGRRPLADRRALLELLERVIHADGTVSVSEYALARLARVHLDDQVTTVEPDARIPASRLEPEIQTVLSLLASCGNPDPARAGAAYERGRARLVPPPGLPYQLLTDWVAAMDAALARLERTRLEDKARLVDAFAAVVMYDGKLEVSEAELLRALCGSIGCPLPQLLRTETVTET